MNNLVDAIEFRARSPRTTLPGLDAARAGLRAISTELDAINGKLTGLTTMSAFKRTQAELKSLLKENLNISQRIPVKDVAKVLGIPDIKDFQAFVQRWKATHAELAKSYFSGSGSKLEFASGAKAAEISRKYFNAALARSKDTVAQLQTLLSGGAPSGGAPGKISVSGTIPLIIPASQIAASVSGAINVSMGPMGPMGPISRPGGGGAAGRSTPVGPGAGGATGPLLSQSEISKPGKTPVIRRRYLEKFGQELEITERAGQEIGRRLTTDVGQQAMENFRKSVASMKRTLASELALPQQQRDYHRIAALREGASDMARTLIASKAGQQMKAMGQTGLLDQLETFASVQSARSSADKQRGLLQDMKRLGKIREELARAREKSDRDEERRLNAERRSMENRIRSQNKMIAAGAKSDEAKAKAAAKVSALSTATADASARRLMSHAGAERALADFLASGGVISRESSRQVIGKSGPVNIRTVEASREYGGQRHTFVARFDEAGASVERLTKKLTAARAEAGYLGADFLKNTAKVTAWAASVMTYQKALELTNFSMQRLLDLGAQTARLQQVFRGVGGSAEDLATDVLHLAAVNGRSSQEAMESAIQWSRLGLTKAQVNEAVRVSLMAANVAELTAAEATDHLQSIMQNYGLTVGQLSTVLGELNQISNTYNVTNADMLEGISRTAAVAKQAGLPLAELMGLIGATVGATGQTGANIGNAIKSVTLALSNPELQSKLRGQFAFESTTGGEDLKTMSALLSDLYVKYQHLNDAQRQSLLFQVAGRTQASRLAAMLDNYVRAQTLAINAQLNLNSAESENAKIKAALRAQLSGLTTEWERFVMVQGNRGPVQAMTQTAAALRNVLTLMNTKGGSWMTTAFGGLLAAGMAKTILTGVTASGSHGFLGKTGAAVRGAMGSLHQTMLDTYVGYLGGAPGMDVSTRKMAIMDKSGAPAKLGLYQRGIANIMMQSERWMMSNSKVARSIGAVTNALGIGLIALRQWALPLALITAGSMAFNAVMEKIGLSSSKAESQLAGVNEKAQAASAAAAAYAQAADLMRTAQDALSPQKGFANMRPEDAKKLLSQVSEAMYQDEPDLGKREKMTEATREQLELMRQQGNLQGIQNILEDRRNAYLDKRKEKLQEEYEALRRTEMVTADELKRLKASAAGPFGFIGSQSRANKIAELERRQQEISGDKTRNLVDQSNAYEQHLQYDKEHQKALEQHKLTMESIAEIFNSIGTNNPFDKALVRMASLDAQLGAISRRRDELSRQDEQDLAGEAERNKALDELAQKEKGVREQMASWNRYGASMNAWGSQLHIKASEAVEQFLFGNSRGSEGLGQANAVRAGLQAQLNQIEQQKKDAAAGYVAGNELGFASRRKQREQLQDEERSLKAQRAALESNLNGYMAHTQFGFGQDQARRDITPFGYGFNETDKLRRQNAEIQRQLKEFDGRDNLSVQDRGRQLELESQYYHNILSLRERAAQVERDINQLVFDRAREMQRSLFEAGPNDLLRKLGAFRTAFDRNGNLRNLSAGQMLAMSPEFRREVAGAQFTGVASGKTAPSLIFDPQLMELFRERNQAAPYAGKGAGGWDNAGLDSLQSQVSATIGKLAGELAKQVPELFKAAAASLDQFADKMHDRVLPVLDAFADRIDALARGGGGGGRGQYGGIGGTAGFRGAGAGGTW